MKRTTLLLNAVCAAALALIVGSPAMAAAPAGFSGNLGINYTDLTASGGGGSFFAGSATGAFGLGKDFAGQAGISLGNAQIGSTSTFNWAVGGSLYWAPEMGRFGGSIGYNSYTIAGGNAGFTTTNYGGFGEWFASDMITVAAKGGAMSLNASLSGCGSLCFGGSGLGSGYYVGGSATGYVIPDVALSGAVDYANFNGSSVTIWSLGGEYLVSEDIPVSVGVGYRNMSVSGGSSSLNEYLVNIKLYFNGDNSMTLRDRQRNGASGWAAAPVGLFQQ